MSDEHVLALQRGQRLAAIEVAAADGVAATRHMPVLDDRIVRHDRAVGHRAGHAHWNLVDLGTLRRLVVLLQGLVAFAHRVAVVRALVNDVDRFPRVQTDRVRDQPVVGRRLRIDREGEPVGIAKAVRPDSPDGRQASRRTGCRSAPGTGRSRSRRSTIRALGEIRMMRWILPTIVSSRCGLVRIACRDSPEPLSPQPT